MECKFEIEFERDKYGSEVEFVASHQTFGFFLCLDIFLAGFTIYIIGISHILMAIVGCIYFIFIFMISFTNFEFAQDTIGYAILYWIAGIILNYIANLSSRTSFYNEKQLKRMTSEQLLIFNNLPDGALIH